MSIRSAVLVAVLAGQCTSILCLAAEKTEQRSLRYGIYTDVQLDGRHVCVLVDTGTNTTVLDEALEPKLVQTSVITVATGNGSHEMRAFKAPDLHWFNKPLKLPKVLTASFEYPKRMAEIDVHGYLGTDALQAAVLHVDFDRNRWTMVKSAPVPPKGAVKIALGMFDRCPSIRLQLPDGRDEEFIIDTGCIGNSAQLRSEVAELMRDEGFARRMGRGRVGSVVGTQMTIDYHLDSLGFGSIKAQDLCVISGDCNLLGMNFLSRFSTVTFDFPNKELILVPGPRLNQPDSINRSGMNFWKLKGYYWVTTVEKDGPAADAGIRKDDLLKQVNGLSVDELGAIRIRELLCGPIAGPQKEKPVKLTLERDGEEFEVSIPLDVWPKPPNYKRLP